MTDHSQNKLDYLIVGQGIAGSSLAYRLLKAGKTVKIIDPGSDSTASQIAGALINPVTGKRIVKSWMIDELIPEAVKLYKELEDFLDAEFLRPSPIHRYFINPEDLKFYQERQELPELRPFLTPLPETEATPFLNKKGGIKISNAYRINSARLIEVFRNYFKENDLLIEEQFNYDQLDIHGNIISYKEIKADQIIFCEGAAAVENPYFNYLPFNLSKGERMLIKMPDLPKGVVYKKGLFIYHLEDDLYYFGSANNWIFEDDQPTQEKREQLLQKVKKMTTLPFDIVDQKGAIKPTVKDRRPFLGQHPKHPALYIFNGLGTKGFSLAPYFSKNMFDYLLEDKMILPEADINRFN